jgi:DNA-binding beta-propeller fold protein YncE
LLSAFGRLGTAPEQIYYGYDMAVDASGNIYFGNMVREGEGMRHDGIKVFSPQGRFVREIGGFDYILDTSDQVHKPYGLDIDRQGRIFAADYGLNTVRVFDPQGQLLVTFFGNQPGDPVPLSGINDIAIDDQNEWLYVADQDANCIQKFQLALDASGALTVTHLVKIGSYGHEPGQVAFPQYLTVDDRTGMLYVGDLANRRIQAFDAQGNYVAHFAPQGVRDWQVMGLTVDSAGDIYAADALNNAIWVFAPGGEEQRQIEIGK